MKHVWQLDGRGEVDEMAHDVQGHNGPRCTVCGYVFCVHCDEAQDGGAWESECSGRMGDWPDDD